MARIVAVLIFISLGVVWLFGQTTGLPVAPGDPLPGLSASEFELFRIGLEDFKEVESAEDGLGPAFNGTSCAVCHSAPAIGGISMITEVRAGYKEEDGTFRELAGGTLYHLFSIPDHRCQVQMPEEANVIARRFPLPIFGDGLVEAIPDETIIAQEDPDDHDGNGISGRAARIIDVASGQQRIGRFGWKAQQATLLAFAGDAYRNEMGITNDLFQNEVALGIDAKQMEICSPPRKGLEDVRDRRTGLRGIDNFDNFMRLLAPVERGPVNDSVRAGEKLFEIIGCNLCHTPSMTTGRSSNPVFDQKQVRLYSDLLLHDVGTGDGIEQAAAKANEIRTPALWGLRLRRPFLHDGSAATIDDAIRRHGVEAARVVADYVKATSSERETLLAFLKSL